jgi:quinohemoprotein ethanol dehydrogenase
MQAPKNGFFYVLDRATGELLSADKYVHVSWASHVDLDTGRPVERPEAVWEEHAATVAPSPEGGHSWHPMSYSPRTGLVYIPTLEMSYLFEPDLDFEFEPGHLNLSEDWAALSRKFEGYEELAGALCSPTRLLAWDPVARQKVWEVGHDIAIPGGVLSTASGLVFQGNGEGELVAYDDRSGERLWSGHVGIGIMAAPITYRVGGEQYVAVLAGVGGDAGTHMTRFRYVNDGRLLAWKLGGKAAMPAVAQQPERRVEAKRLEASASTVARGQIEYAKHCAVCHGFGTKGSGLYPDLRFSSADVHERWQDIVLGGVRGAQGMASFADILSVEDANAIHAYVVERALHEPGVLERLAGWLSRHACIPASWTTD